MWITNQKELEWGDDYMGLKMYTKEECVYCHMLAERLKEWGVEYTAVPFSDTDRTFAKYPQLMFDDNDVLLDDTAGLTLELLTSRIDDLSSVEIWGEHVGCDFTLRNPNGEV